MAFERNPDTVQVKAEVRVMWPDGPSRRWSSVRCSEARDPYGEKDGYVGNYVCQSLYPTSHGPLLRKSRARSTGAVDLCGRGRSRASAWARRTTTR